VQIHPAGRVAGSVRDHHTADVPVGFLPGKLSDYIAIKNDLPVAQGHHIHVLGDIDHRFHHDIRFIGVESVSDRTDALGIQGKGG